MSAIAYIRCVYSLCVPSPEHYGDLYAYQYKPKDGEIVKQSSGWALFDCSSEYGRMGVPNQYWKATNLNDNYEVHVCTVCT